MLQGHPEKTLDRYDPETKTHSMARTTGYTATVALRLLAEGHYQQAGICPPEYLGRSQACVDFMLSGLRERGVRRNLRARYAPVQRARAPDVRRRGRLAKRHGVRRPV